MLYTAYFSNELDDSLRVANILTCEDITNINIDILVNYTGLEVYEGEKLAYIKTHKLYAFASDENDFNLVKEVTNQLRN